MSIKKHSFDNGKYEIHAAYDGSSLVAYRHGELWQNMIGDNLTAAMLHTIDDLQASSQRLVLENKALLHEKARLEGKLKYFQDKLTETMINNKEKNNE